MRFGKLCLMHYGLFTTNSAWSIKILHFALLIIVMMFSQSCGSKALREPSVRPMAVAGQFYPADADSLRAMVAESFRGTKSTV